MSYFFVPTTAAAYGSYRQLCRRSQLERRLCRILYRVSQEKLPYFLRDDYLRSWGKRMTQERWAKKLLDTGEMK